MRSIVKESKKKMKIERHEKPRVQDRENRSREVLCNGLAEFGKWRFNGIHYFQPYGNIEPS